MTERLTHLMHAEADLLDVPPAPALAILARGRAARRRRRWTSGLAAAVVVALVGVGTAAILDSTRDDGSQVADRPTASAYQRYGAFAVGDRVHVGGTGTSATLPAGVQSLHYTSAGVVARTNDSAAGSSGAGRQHLTLVRPDGTVQELGIVLRDTVPGSDPSQPYLAWSEGTDSGSYEVVVLDVATGQEMARVSMPGDAGRSGWATPPVALSGDVVYAGLKSSTLAVDWRTGEIDEVQLDDGLELGGGIPQVAGGRAMLGYGESSAVFDLRTGAPLLRVEFEEYGWLQLSPDGRYAKAVDEMADAEGDDPGAGFDVHDLAAGSVVRIPGRFYEYGWSPDGHLVKVDEDSVVSCDARTGACEELPARLELGDDVSVRLGGLSYES